jgi:hypothetical protein
MPECPKCKVNIDHLHNVETGSAGWEMNYDENRKGQPVHYQQMDEFFLPDGGQMTWECPECDEILFNKEADAIEFLKKK